MMLADLDIPLSALTGWLPGLLAFLFLLALLLTIWNQGKKAFGRKPPLNEELETRDKKLRSEIYHVNGSTKKELNGRLNVQAERMAAIEQDVSDLNLANARSQKENMENIHALELIVSRLAGRCDAVLQKLEG